MKPQKLRAFNDFLRRAAIISESLLVITENSSADCYRAISELRIVMNDIPFYEINISENPNLREELAEYYEIERLPTFIYFRGIKVVSQMVGLEKAENLSSFLNEVIHLEN